MITGDKQETAINIATSCKLIGSLEGLLVCNSPFSRETARAKMEELIALMGKSEGSVARGVGSKVSHTPCLAGGGGGGGKGGGHYRGFSHAILGHALPAAFKMQALGFEAKSKTSS